MILNIRVAAIFDLRWWRHLSNLLQIVYFDAHLTTGSCTSHIIQLCLMKVCTLLTASSYCTCPFLA